MFANQLKPVPSDVPAELLRAAPEEVAGEIRKRTLQTASNILKAIAVVVDGHDRVAVVVAENYFK